jgi:hypothetical protein
MDFEGLVGDENTKRVGRSRVRLLAFLIDARTDSRVRRASSSSVAKYSSMVPGLAMNV